MFEVVYVFEVGGGDVEGLDGGCNGDVDCFGDFVGFLEFEGFVDVYE